MTALIHGGKATPWTGWNAPSVHERTLLHHKCGRKCFLGPRNKFPICSAGSCKINKKGVWAAYVRARSQTGNKSKHSSKSRKRSSKSRKRSSKSRKRSSSSSSPKNHRLTKKQYRKIASRARRLI